ncbi:MAG TPA: FAD-binding oxidoreductase [Usitatibacteraceae bacterium]|nr:FAD-binding oxidoreductase [Usitatibacteraceae bacterium]
MKPESYWLDTAPAFTDSPGEPGEGGRPDVCVVGGGYTGLSAAYWLARSGAKVTLVEAGGIAHEASGRNGGHCNNGLSPGYASVVAAFGAERARLMYHDFESAVTAVESLVREEAIDCDFGRCGKLKMAVKPTTTRSRATTRPCTATWIRAWNSSAPSACARRSTPRRCTAPSCRRRAPSCTPAASAWDWRRRPRSTARASTRTRA